MTSNNQAGKFVIGLIEEAGAGKEVAQTILEDLGVFTIDPEDVADDLLVKDAPGYHPVVDQFGEDILDSQGQIDRLKLYQLVNADRQSIEKLRAIMDPLIKEAVIHLINRNSDPAILITADNWSLALLREFFDQVWVVTAPEKVRISYLVREKGWSHDRAEQHLQKLPGIEKQLAGGVDFILRNTGSLDTLREQIRAVWGKVDMPPTSEQLDRPVELIESSQSPDSAFSPRFSALTSKEVKAFGRRMVNVLTTLLVIAYLTSWGLILAERGRERLPAQPFQAAWESILRVGNYLINHPETYYWHKENVAAFQVVSETLKASAGLLLISLGLALAIGLPLGITAAVTKRKTSSALVMLFSILGISTPSFLLAMLLWIVNIWVHRTFDIQVLPSGGFGWDAHLIMPAIVLSMRPLAQIAQVTYVTMSDILGQDYIRTAYSKGLSWSKVRNVHVLPNILIPTLTTLGSSLRYSLASLPVVELFFAWPGVGLMLLDAIQQGNFALVVDLILSLGLFFLFVNLLIEITFPLIDARLRDKGDTAERKDAGAFLGWIRQAGNTVSAWARDLRQRFTRQETSDLPPLPDGLNLLPIDKEQPGIARRRWLLRHFLANPVFILGTVMLVALLGFVLFGEQLSDTSPYQVHGVMTVEGEIGAPPFEPSSVFPWGTDHIGRDIQALVLAGGKRTLVLAFFGMLARLLLGATLGLLAGWQRSGWVDRMVTGAVGVWAAYPVTLFAMIVIQALGIQQGMWVFVVAISVVGWGEVAQFVRGQVISIKPQLFIESARSVGSRPDQIMVRHVIPNLVNTLIVLAALEMGGILMLLAELGYLNIFMGGGFRVMIGEAGRMVPIVAFYSDVPEWAALIANVRQYWRSYPWMALYPGLAVFLSIVAFNMFGEGLRRFLEDTYSNLSRLFNRYTLFASIGLAAIVAFVLQSSLPLSVYRPEGLKFDEQRVMQDIENLSSPTLQGRETGMPGATMAAIYIAYRMEEIGIFPAGQHGTYFQHLAQSRIHLYEKPTLTILDDFGQTQQRLTYKRDFVEYSRTAGSIGEEQAPIMGAAFGPILDPALTDEFGLSNSEAMDHILIVRAEDIDKVNLRQIKGVLMIANETQSLERRDLYPYRLMPREDFRPILVITPEIADSLLKSAGSSLAELDEFRASLEPGKMQLTAEGAQVSMSLLPRRAEIYQDEKYINVIGVIPGQGHFMGVEDQVIVVSAYYDGLGTDLNGTLYPGANDNASGVAMMLELARLLKESTYQPDKTVMFVAWAGGERQEGLSVVDMLNARPGGNKLTVESVIELSGVGFGTGSSINLGNDSSYRLVKLIQEAASRYNLQTTTRGRNPHFGLPLPTAFGGRDAMTLSISWDGSDFLAHTPQDTLERIDPAKLYDVGRTTYLTLLVLSRETEY